MVLIIKGYFMSLIPLYRMLLISVSMIAATWALTFYTYAEMAKLTQ